MLLGVERHPDGLATRSGWIGTRQPWRPARSRIARSGGGEPGRLGVVVGDLVLGADSPELAVDDYVAVERVGDVFGGWSVGGMDGDCGRSFGRFGSVVAGVGGNGGVGVGARK